MTLPFDAYWDDETQYHDSEINGWEFVYQQSTGQFALGFLYDSAASGIRFIRRLVIERGYSGRGDDQDNPQSERLVARGPIPRGAWAIRPAQTHAQLGPIALRLDPLQGTHTFGRSGFLIHGDNRSANKTASSGCIILSRATRQFVEAQRARRPVLRLHVIA